MFDKRFAVVALGKEPIHAGIFIFDGCGLPRENWVRCYEDFDTLQEALNHPATAWGAFVIEAKRPQRWFQWRNRAFLGEKLDVLLRLPRSYVWDKVG